MAAVEMSAANRVIGTVRWFNATTGSGFVTPDNGGEYLYFHQPSLKSDGVRSFNGDSIEFEIRADWDGRPRAFDITAPGGGALTGGSHGGALIGCGGGGGGACYDGGCSSYGIDNVRGFYSCGEEGASLPMVCGCTAVQVFDEMPLGNVIWDEFGNDLDVDGGLLQQLAMGAEYVIEEEATAVSDEQCMFVDVSSESVTPVVFDEMSPSDVVWDDVPQNGLDSCGGLLQQLALGGQYLDGENTKPTVRLDAAEQEFREIHDEVLNSEVCAGGVESDIKLIYIGSSFLRSVLGEKIHKHGMDVADQVLDEMLSQQMQGEMFGVMVLDCVSSHGDIPLGPYCFSMEDVSCVLNGWSPWWVEACFNSGMFGFSPWSKLTDKALRLVFLAYACLMDMIHRRLYIFFKQWDPGISWVVLENTRGCTIELLVPVLQMIPTINLTERLPYLKLSFSAISSILTWKMLQSESEMVEMLLCWETISCSSDKKMRSHADMLVTQFPFTISMFLLWLKASRCQAEFIKHDRAYSPVKIWDPGILKPIYLQFEILGYTTAGTYVISSSVLLVQSSVTLLVPLLQVLNHAYLLSLSVFSASSISSSIWLKLRVFLVTVELKMMVFRLFAQEETCESVRSERQQARVGYEDTDVQLRTGGNQEIKSISDSLRYDGNQEVIHFYHLISGPWYC